MDKIIKIILGVIVSVLTTNSVTHNASPQVVVDAVIADRHYDVELKLKGNKTCLLKSNEYVYKNGDVNYEKVQQYVYDNYSDIKKRILFKKSDCGVMEIRHLPEELKFNPIVSLCNDVGVKSIPPV